MTRIPRLVMVLGLTTLMTTASTVPAFAQDDKNCDDFSSESELREYVSSHPGDPSNLDGDNDGYYCESQFGTAVRAAGASTAGLASTGPADAVRLIEFTGLMALFVGWTLRTMIRKPAKHRRAWI